jgi:hypothetical protein
MPPAPPEINIETEVMLPLRKACNFSCHKQQALDFMEVITARKPAVRKWI